MEYRKQKGGIAEMESLCNRKNRFLFPAEPEGGVDEWGVSRAPDRKRHIPRVLVETEHLPEEEWLSYRRRGIGGSDVAAILGISPFRTAGIYTTIS